RATGARTYSAPLLVLPLLMMSTPMAGQTPQESTPAQENSASPASQPAEAAAASQPSEACEEKPKPAAPKNYYMAPKEIGPRLETQPPRYVRTFNQFGIPGTEKLSWLEFGLENRVRYEHRDDEYRPYAFKILKNNQPLLRPFQLLEDNESFL